MEEEQAIALVVGIVFFLAGCVIYHLRLEKLFCKSSCRGSTREATPAVSGECVLEMQESPGVLKITPVPELGG